MLITLDPKDHVRAVNERYLERTGNREDEVLGRHFWDELLATGSRIFYQTQLMPVLQMDRQLEEVMIDLRHGSGERLPALMNAIRRVDSDGAPVETLIALMSVPDRRAFEDSLRHARDAAEHARRDAEQARGEAEAARALTEQALETDAQTRRRLELLAQANTALASTLDIDLALEGLARVLASRLATWCVIELSPGDQPASEICAAAHTDPSKQADTVLLAQALLDDVAARSDLRRLIDEAVPALAPSPIGLVRLDAARAVQTTGHDEAAAAISRDRVDDIAATIGSASTIIVPASAHQAQVATIVLGRGADRDPFTEDDLADTIDVAARVGIVIGNLRSQAREHSNSIALQNALLTTPPTETGFQIATRYQPATNGNEVGGDWYDALLQPAGSLVVVIGDVVGHDIHAAAAMGQLRGITRTLAYTTAATAAGLLTQTDSTARGLGVGVLASAIVAQLRHEQDGNITLQCSNAGHPPPLLIASGRGEVLHIPPDPPLGLRTNHQRHDHARTLHAGDTLILYTDGLVENTENDIYSDIASIAEHLDMLGPCDVEQVCDALLKARTGNTQDDIAIIAIRVGPDNNAQPQQ